MRRIHDLLVLTLLALAACSATPMAEPPRGAADTAHAHLASAFVLLDGSTRGLGPSASLRMDQEPFAKLHRGETLFFRNPDPSRFLQVRIDGDFRGCAQCVTVTGFACLEDGAQSRAIEPGGIATLCFHDAGRFEVQIRGGAADLGGVLEVAP